MIKLTKTIILYTKLLWHWLTFYTFTTPEESHYTNVGNVYFDLERYNEAITYFKRSQEKNTNKDPAFTRYTFYYLGYSYLNLGNHGEAAGYFRKYLLFAADDLEVMSLLGWCYLLLNDYEAASQVYKRLTELAPDSPGYRIEYAKILSDSGRKHEAIQQLYLTNEQFDDSALEQVVEALKFAMSGEFGNAIPALTRAIKNLNSSSSVLQSQVEDLYMLLSEYQKENGDFQNAIRTLEEVHRNNPKDLWIMNSLAFEYADQDVNLEKALRLVDYCVEYQPENSFFIDTKAWVLFKLGQMDEAKALIERSLELNPNVRTTQQHYKILGGKKES